jgi:cysteinyl-tRNA synthetase
MVQKYLGDTIDIHTGGIDHIPTHHNNEIAQTESLTNKPLANYWMHSSHVLIDGKKISKSLGNTIYFENLEAKNINPLAFRYWILTADYKTLINFTWDAITAADTAFKKLITQLSSLDVSANENGKSNEQYKEKFTALVNDDLNTAAGIALIWELLKDADISDADKQATIYDFDAVLGLNIEPLVQLARQLKNDAVTPEAVLAIGKKRAIAREQKNWNEASRWNFNR